MIDVRECPWRPVKTESSDLAYDVELSRAGSVSIRLALAIHTDYSLRARNWRISCGRSVLTARWLHYANFEFELDGQPFTIKWEVFPSRGAFNFPGEQTLRFEEDSNGGYVLKAQGGAKMAHHKRPWKDSQVQARIPWVAHLENVDLRWPYGGIAIGLLGVIGQMRIESSSDSSDIAPLPVMKREPAPSAKPTAPTKPILAPMKEEKEVLWKLVEQRSGIDVIKAKFPEGEITVERIGQTLFNPYGKLVRVIVGDWIVAIERMHEKRPTVYSNSSDIVMTLNVTVDSPIVTSGEIEITGLASLYFERAEVAGYWLSRDGKRLVRHARPWKDSHQEDRVQWVSYPSAEPLEWPIVGIGLGMLDILKPRIQYG